VIAPLGFPAPAPAPADDFRQTVSWLADHNRQVAEAHMALADKAEQLMHRFLADRRSRSSLRNFARHNRRAAWQHLEMARRAEAMLQQSSDSFDLGDVVSS
jgi:hypothetical protein